MNVETLLFWLFALLACGGAISVAVSQNVVRMAFSLVLCLGSTAVMFLLLGADFVGATQLMVYVGGTVVLLVFGVMLTATGPHTKIKSSGADAILSGLIGVVFLFIVSTTVTAVDWGDAKQKILIGTHQRDESRGFNPEQQGNTTRPLGLSFLSVRADRDLKLNIGGEAAGLGKSEEGLKPLSSGYLLPFEIVSIHLLVVLVGASYLARAKRRVTTSQ